MLPQVPQLVGSFAGLTQTLPGQVSPGHVAWQPKLAAQNGAVCGQTLPHWPQLKGSEAGFVQTVPHSNKPFVHTHSPLTHCRPGAHPPLQSLSLSSSSPLWAAGVHPTNKMPTSPTEASSRSSRFMVRQSVIGAANAQGDSIRFSRQAGRMAPQLGLSNLLPMLKNSGDFFQRSSAELAHPRQKCPFVKGRRPRLVLEQSPRRPRASWLRS